MHIFSGFTALFIGLVPMFSKKGGNLHKVTGMIYFWAMFGVFLTTCIMFAHKPNSLLFLFLIGLFSFYQTLSGYRTLKYKTTAIPTKLFDKITTVGIWITSISMVLLGIYSFIIGQTGSGILYSIFGLFLFGEAVIDYKFYLAKKTISSRDKPTKWLYRHITRMGSSYIATFSAFVVVNNTMLPNLVAWIAPGIIGGIILTFVVKKYQIDPA